MDRICSLDDYFSHFKVFVDNTYFILYDLSRLNDLMRLCMRFSSRISGKLASDSKSVMIGIPLGNVGTEKGKSSSIPWQGPFSISQISSQQSPGG